MSESRESKRWWAALGLTPTRTLASRSDQPSAPFSRMSSSAASSRAVLRSPW
ncbi:hypothetical protein SAMN05660976_03353 [Nonomuraea pusilla]|uniref:Uncharacterized protein n=1 Tax=Nonomuraea pusilla TaxID=46177 RepID=A0A1H7T4X4_9ACTN|nr:hypothetical protein [Nonomuraea pusilla]SEL79952.1 hypothetical protein SAMN05660976_03353 [Nonomuraea pusilla]